MTKAKSTKPVKTTSKKASEQSNAKSFDMRIAYGIGMILWLVVAVLVGSQAIDTASMWVYALFAVSVYFLVSDSYKFVKAVKEKRSNVTSSGKPKKA